MEAAHDWYVYLLYQLLIDVSSEPTHRSERLFGPAARLKGSRAGAVGIKQGRFLCSYELDYTSCQYMTAALKFQQQERSAFGSANGIFAVAVCTGC